ncbi:unnamed protein product [Xylocopa violacea]|uniref:Uncharacterized protein n=1 Tax=Xylocopa violacea TaxID=135666 RepID=A0ABP1NCF9_XYLVO
MEGESLNQRPLKDSKSTRDHRHLFVGDHSFPLLCPRRAAIPATHASHRSARRMENISIDEYLRAINDSLLFTERALRRLGEISAIRRTRNESADVHLDRFYDLSRYRFSSNHVNGGIRGARARDIALESEREKKRQKKKKKKIERVHTSHASRTKPTTTKPTTTTTTRRHDFIARTSNVSQRDTTVTATRTKECAFRFRVRLFARSEFRFQLCIPAIRPNRFRATSWKYEISSRNTSHSLPSLTVISACPFLVSYYLRNLDSDNDRARCAYDAR